MVSLKEVGTRPVEPHTMCTPESSTIVSCWLCWSLSSKISNVVQTREKSRSLSMYPSSMRNPESITICVCACDAQITQIMLKEEHMQVRHLEREQAFSLACTMLESSQAEGCAVPQQGDD